MLPEAYFSLFLVGLVGGGHCIGMCGGIVSALSMNSRAQPFLHLAYNAGRLFSYSVAGALVGTLGGMSMAISGIFPMRIILFVLANLMLIALGFYLLGASKILAFTERFGQKLWRRLQPLTKRFLPARTIAQAFPLGVLWGWLPCGMVYSALGTAMMSGSALQGAGMMLAFGAGTLPSLLLAGLLAVRMRAFAARPAVRYIAGGLVLAFGVHGLWAVPRMLHMSAMAH